MESKTPVQEIRAGILSAFKALEHWVRPQKNQPVFIQVLLFILKIPILLLLLVLSPVLLVVLLLVSLIAL